MRRSLIELLDLPHVFSQQALLSPDEFCSECEKRGLRIDVAQLEALHRAGVIAPVFEILRDWRAFDRARKLDPYWPISRIPIDGIERVRDLPSRLRRAQTRGDFDIQGSMDFGRGSRGVGSSTGYRSLMASDGTRHINCSQYRSFVAMSHT